MGIPSIDPADVGTTGLIWLLVSYGYVLYYAADLIGEGSELLLLVPSMAGLVGGVVLPLLGAVPDGAIVLFSGLGDDLKEAQETLAVGVGALAGSTIMLLTVPLSLSVYGGRVDIIEGIPNYQRKPKLTEHVGIMGELKETGVAMTEAVHHGGILMLMTTIPYFLIQVPAFFMHGPKEEVARGEHWWSFAGFCVCLLGLCIYMNMQLKISKAGEDKHKRVAIMKKVLKKGQMSLSGAIASHVKSTEAKLAKQAATEYQSFGSAPNPNNPNADNPNYPPPAVAEYLMGVLADSFYLYDDNKNGQLDKYEVKTFFRDFHEAMSEEEMDALFKKFDTDKSGYIDLNEFIGLAYSLIKVQEGRRKDMDSSARSSMTDASQRERNAKTIAETAFSEVEEEEVPEEFTDLSPEEQQTAIKRRAFFMLATGTVLVVLFSDPMVDVLQEVAVRSHIPPFYVSFILAPLASNASEVVSSMYYASKKTRKTITVSLTALEGAACMNNTFCLSIFMGLIFFRGLAWQYTAETVSILIVEVILCVMVQKEYMTMLQGLFVMLIFPLSIALVAILEALGFD